jgi:regulatory protein
MTEKNGSQEAYHKCREVALRYLDYRSRSESELMQYLSKDNKFTRDEIETVLRSLKKIGLIDDKRFAEIWVRSRTTYRQKSKFMIKRELLQKGVPTDIIDDALAIVNDEESALSVGLKKAKLLKDIDYGTFFTRMSSFLARRGYNSDVARSVTIKLWESRSKNP